MENIVGWNKMVHITIMFSLNYVQISTIHNLNRVGLLHERQVECYAEMSKNSNYIYVVQQHNIGRVLNQS